MTTVIVLKLFAQSTNTPQKVSETRSQQENVNNFQPTDIIPPEDETVLGTDDVDILPDRITGKVVKVRDGDTIEIDIEGVVKVVRYIGIDTPETVDPRKGVQCFGKEASNINKSLVENQIVTLEKDVSETDKYGRLLRYVYLNDLLVNQHLVEKGFAYSSAYPPDVKYQENLDAAEEEARVNNKGLWGTCGGVSNNSSRQANTTSSNDKDCSDFSTHQEAQDYFVSIGGSHTNNADKLDGSDHDGLVCETLP